MTIPTADRDNFGGQSSVSCCCLRPPQQSVNGDAKKPTSCNAVCAAAGLSCDGGNAGYVRDADGSFCSRQLACADTPSAQSNCAGRASTLETLQCDCR